MGGQPGWARRAGGPCGRAGQVGGQAGQAGRAGWARRAGQMQMLGRLGGPVAGSNFHFGEVRRFELEP